MIFSNARQSTLVALASLVAAIASSSTLQAQEAEPVYGRQSLSEARNRELDVQLIVGGSHSDNILRRPPGAEESGNFATPGALIAYKHDARRLEADIQLQARYENYLDGHYSDGIYGWLNGAVELALVPERLTWVLEDNFGQTRLDPLAAQTPDNRENINFLTTGPDFNLLLGNAATAQFFLRYSNLHYQTSDLGGDRYSGGLSLIRGAAVGAISLNLATERVEIRPTELNFDRHSAFGRYEAHGSRTDVELDIGYTQITGFGRTDDGLLVEVGLRRRTSVSSTVTLGAGTSFSDAGEFLRSGRGNPGSTYDSVQTVATSDPFKADFASLQWDFQRARTELSLYAEASRHRYENQRELDRTLAVHGASASRRLTQKLTLSVGVRSVHEDFDRVDVKTRELLTNAALSIRLGAATRLQLNYLRTERDSRIRSSEFTDNEISLGIAWSPVSPTSH